MENIDPTKKWADFYQETTGKPHQLFKKILERDSSIEECEKQMIDALEHNFSDPQKVIKDAEALYHRDRKKA